MLVLMPETKTRRRIGRPPLTDRPTLLAAAFGIGFEKLTVGRVSTKVGIKYSTFYRHFPSLADLISTMCDQELRALEEADDQDLAWYRYLHVIVGVLHNRLLDNPGMAEKLTNSLSWPLPLTAAHSRSVARLKRQGFTDKEAVEVADTVVHMVIRLPHTLRVPAVMNYLEGVAAG